MTNRNARIVAVLSGQSFPLVVASLFVIGLVVAIVTSGQLAGGGGGGGGGDGSADTLTSHPYYPSSYSSSTCLGWDLSKGRWSKGARACARSPHAVAGCNDYLRPRVASRHRAVLKRQRALDAVAKRSVRAWEFTEEVRERCGAVRVDRQSLHAPTMLEGKHVAVVEV